MADKYHSAVFLQKPYPKINITQKNKEYAALLSNCYCGVEGEMTVLCTYLYNHMLLDNGENAVISRIFELVSQTEMLHFQMLGKIICALGGIPVFASFDARRGKYWTVRNVVYNSSADSMLRAAIASEERSVMEYRRLISLIKDKNIVDILERFILDEEHHMAIFSELLAEKRI